MYYGSLSTERKYDFSVYPRRLVVKEGVTFACKIVSKELTSPIYRTKFLPRELKILGSMRHPHIARIYTIIEEPSKVFIIMELATGGDLLEKIMVGSLICADLVYLRKLLLSSDDQQQTNLSSLVMLIVRLGKSVLIYHVRENEDRVDL